LYGTEKREGERLEIYRRHRPLQQDRVSDLQGYVHLKYFPLFLHSIKSKAARTSELRKPNNKSTDIGPIWLADFCDGGIFPETYSISGNTKETENYT
jgi:hypothetical protein